MRPALALIVALAAAGSTSLGQAAQPSPQSVAAPQTITAPALPAPVTEQIESPVIESEPQAAPVVAEVTGEPDWKLQARLYHAGGGGAGALDSLGCAVVPLRTVAIDPRVVPKRTILYIAEMDGLRMANGRVHDGLVYASDTGGGIKGSKIDLFTGHGKASMKPAMPLNLKRLTVSKAGTFKGCPPKA